MRGCFRTRAPCPESVPSSLPAPITFSIVRVVGSGDADDAALFDRWRDGDPSAGQALISRHFPSVRRFFRNKGGAAAEDLVQETLARCVRSRDRFEQRSSYRTFVLSTARYVLFEHLRRITSGRETDYNTTSVEALDPSPSQLIARDDERQLLLASMRKLPLEQQIALELYYWEDMNLAQIAAVTEAPVGTVKSRLWMARQALRRHMGEEPRP